LHFKPYPKQKAHQYNILWNKEFAAFLKADFFFTPEFNGKWIEML
jgi:hypothetical protein